jgi:hypothetical protein
MRKSPAIAAALLAALAGCVATPSLPPPARVAAHLPRHGMAADGRHLLLAASPADHCFTASLHTATAALPMLASLDDAGPVEAGCRPWTSAAAADGSLLAIYAYNQGTISLVRRDGDRLLADTVLRLPGTPGFPYPPPGRSLAVAPDGSSLLVGAVERDCALTAAGSRCGAAYLYRRGPAGWQLAARIGRPRDAGETAHFGQTLAMLSDGRLLIGGTGIAGGPGALHLFAPEGSGYRHIQTLHPDGPLAEFYATDLAVSGDGSWIAVGGGQSVSLYRPGDDGRLALAQRLALPEENAGHFGDVLALNGDGSTLLVGAPRAACSQGPRCGIVYRYRPGPKGFSLVGPIQAARPEPHAAFGRELALDAQGGRMAIEGAGVELVIDHAGS